MSDIEIRFPIKRKSGGQGKARVEYYDDSLRDFADDLNKIQSQNDFKMGVREWCYLLEPMGLNKSNFDWGAEQIREARIRGYLRPGFILEDESHEVEEQNEYPSTPEEFHEIKYKIWRESETTYFESARRYNDDEVSFWEDKNYYIQLVVEKVGLKSLFRNICKKYKIPIANLRGWGSLEQKAVLAMKFQEMEQYGLQPVLLACGDFDPPGLAISKYLKGQFEEYSTFTGWNSDNLIVDRIGLSYEYIIENALVWIPNLETGSKKDLSNPNHPMYKRNTYDIRGYIKKYGARKVEANALIKNPEHGRELLQNVIDKYLGVDAYKNYQEKIYKGRLTVQKLIDEQE